MAGVATAGCRRAVPPRHRASRVDVSSPATPAANAASAGRPSGSATRAADFDPAGSDVDFLVTFSPQSGAAFAAFLDFNAALEALFVRPVDLIERQAVETSRNYIRRRRILAEAEAVYG